MIDWEVGDFTFWISFERNKPFSLCVYRKNGEWKHDIHMAPDMDEMERIELEGFIKERIGDLNHMWRVHMNTRLNWDTNNIKKRKKK